MKRGRNAGAGLGDELHLGTKRKIDRLMSEAASERRRLEDMAVWMAGYDY